MIQQVRWNLTEFFFIKNQLKVNIWLFPFAQSYYFLKMTFIDFIFCTIDILLQSVKWHIPTMDHLLCNIENIVLLLNYKFNLNVLMLLAHTIVCFLMAVRLRFGKV